ncbi:Piso0_000747 [Millerozyma farinosa CBS 7064]|uniref:Piso0_000747 protein n=1 Tax=Pichia sorbitophila (strain ATCC MYA-4447 / BCRC 22081 / CBS 7064 / NBRC 10061 / NRRL Y-12695) TaxID=559304 RepID=G8YPY3_PICSO|nr:Piso0_000747 [Millerozyma farinosa CBS 7064]
MDFDPLSLFTPKENVVEDGPTVILEEVKMVIDPVPRDEHLYPLHALDLPILGLRPPHYALEILLKLFAPDETLNFEKKDSVLDEDQNIDPKVVLESRNIAEDILSEALLWFTKYSPRFDSVIKLAYIPSLSGQLKESFPDEYNRWLVSVISNDLSWVLKEKVEGIKKLASTRLAENCGRVAQPEIIRRIHIRNLDKYLGEDSCIRLKEPSLTSDNLGLKTWGSSLVLANRLVNESLRRENYLESPVLELGSGTGLSGFVSSIVGFKTYLTDLPDIVDNLKDNRDLNNIDASVEVLDWTDPHSFLEKYGSIKFKTIILSDPIYSKKHPVWISQMIDLFLDDGPKSSVLIQVPLRENFEKERNLLWSLLEKKLDVIEEEIEDGADDFGETKFCFKRFTVK